MTERVIVAGTDTGIGKTVFAAALTGALKGFYWKPVQAGLAGGTDSETVLRLTGLPAHHVLAEAYRLKLPASPHLAAAREGITIDLAHLALPAAPGPLVIEGAGGLLVPLAHTPRGRGGAARTLLQADVFARWRLPVILCASTRLGAINHALLSLEALARRFIPVYGVAFIGDAQPDTEAAISGIAGVRRLGRLPWLTPLTRDTLAAAFAAAFSLEDLAR